MRYGLVLVTIEVASPKKIVEKIRSVEGVLDVYDAFSRFDIIVFIEAEDYYKLKDVAAEVAEIEGIKRTETLVHGD